MCSGRFRFFVLAVLSASSTPSTRTRAAARGVPREMVVIEDASTRMDTVCAPLKVRSREPACVPSAKRVSRSRARSRIRDNPADHISPRGRYPFFPVRSVLTVARAQGQPVRGRPPRRGPVLEQAREREPAAARAEAGSMDDAGGRAPRAVRARDPAIFRPSRFPEKNQAPARLPSVESMSDEPSYRALSSPRAFPFSLPLD